MSWKDLLADPDGTDRIVAWLGGRKIHRNGRTWTVKGRLPAEYGWHVFHTERNRKAKYVEPSEFPDPFVEDEYKTFTGYLIGDRFVADDARVDPDPDKIIEQTETVFAVPLGLERFTRAKVARWDDGKLVFLGEEFPAGPEPLVVAAYQDRKDSVTDIKEVTPALDLAFRWESWGRVRAEERARELERLRLEEEARLAAEERMRQAMRDAGTGAGRRALAQRDFDAAARAALAISGAELLDTRQAGHNRMVVNYRFRHRRLECEVNKDTLQIIDAGVCLDNHRGERGDTYFTLESLPAVIGEAMDRGILHVYRHFDGYDEDYY